MSESASYSKDIGEVAADYGLTLKDVNDRDANEQIAAIDREIR
jgi:hypothetical protein